MNREEVLEALIFGAEEITRLRERIAKLEEDNAVLRNFLFEKFNIEVGKDSPLRIRFIKKEVAS